MTSAPQPSLTPNPAALFARASRNSSQVIVPVNDSALNRATPEASLYCVHSISGTAGIDFFDLAKRLDLAVRFYGIQAPPREMINARFGSSIESIAAHYTEALTKFQPSGPLVLGGYCAGAVIALEMAKNLRQSGREVGPLLVIDGVPENAPLILRNWHPQYWRELARNIPGWSVHADLVRMRSLRALLSSISKNAVAIGKRLIGLRPSQKLSGGFAMDGLTDLSIYPIDQRLFINRLVNSLFAYQPEEYRHEVTVYEAGTTPLLDVPQIGSRWCQLAPKAEIVKIIGTHLGMMHAPYVDALAEDIRSRVTAYFSLRSA